MRLSMLKSYDACWAQSPQFWRQKGGCRIEERVLFKQSNNLVWNILHPKIRTQTDCLNQI